MANVKFIGTSYLKTHTTIQENVDDNILVPFIEKAQDLHIQQALGSSFYNHLKNAITGSTLTSAETTLIREYIQPALCEWTLYEVLPHIQYKLTNKSVSQQSSEFSQPSTLEDIKYLRNTVRDMAEFFLKRLNKQLCDYPNLYPAFLNPTTPENLARNGKSYFGGIHIPKRGPSGIRTYDDPSDDCNNC